MSQDPQTPTPQGDEQRTPGKAPYKAPEAEIERPPEGRKAIYAACSGPNPDQCEGDVGS